MSTFTHSHPSDHYWFVGALAAPAETELPEEMKQEESDQTENPQQEKENDQQKANVQREDHPLLDLIPITPPFDFCRFAYYTHLSLSLSMLSMLATAFD